MYKLRIEGRHAWQLEQGWQEGTTPALSELDGAGRWIEQCQTYHQMTVRQDVDGGKAGAHSCSVIVADLTTETWQLSETAANDLYKSLAVHTPAPS